jgi:hypothetical protein
MAKQSKDLREGLILPDVREPAHISRRGLDGATALLTAIFTDAINLEVMPGGIKMIFAANLFFQLAQLRREELDGRIALGADHVVVAASVELVLITGRAVRKWNCAGQAAFRQQFKRTVDRGESNLGIFLAHQAKKLVSGKMVARLKKSTQDGIALVSMLEPNAL